MTALRLVLDTNTILMSLARQNTNEVLLRQAWEQHLITPIISNYTRSELLKTLGEYTIRNRSNRQENADIFARYLRYLGYCTTVEIPLPPPETPPCRDMSDQPFLILAYQAKADYLVTTDEDLLVLKDDSEIQIIRPSDLFVILHSTFP